MDRRVLTVVALAAMLLLAGCSSYLSNTGGENPSDSVSTVSPGGAATTPTATDANPTEATPTDATPTDTGVDTTPTDTGAETTTETPEPWSPPPEPNTPLEKALNGSQGNRIAALEHVDDGFGAATGDVTLAVRANTSMADVDPADMGTVRGEPFFLVYVNGSLHPGGEWAGSQFYRVEGTRAVKTNLVDHREDGTFELTVPAGAFEAEGTEGEVDVMVLLMDRDKQWDDVYGAANVTVDYELPPEADDGTPTEGETSSDDGGTMTPEESTVEDGDDPFATGEESEGDVDD